LDYISFEPSNHSKFLLENIELLLYHKIMKKPNLRFRKNSTWNTRISSVSKEALSLCPTEAGHFYALSDYLVARAFHNSFLLIYTVRGLGEAETPDGKAELLPGTAVLIDCHKPHKYCSVDGEWEFLWMHFDGTLAGLCFEMAGGCPSVIKPQDTDTFFTAFLEITELISHGEPLSLLKCEKLMTELLYSLCESTVIQKDGTQMDSKVLNITDYINSNYRERLTIADISKKFGVSEYHLIRCFKRNMGIPPYAYITNRRIAEAKRMLAITQRPVTDIATLCGFSDSAAFIASFKERTGKTPLQYRKMFA